MVTCFRIGDPGGLFPIFNATGSTLVPGRWNTAAAPMIYAATHYSLAMLEKLANGAGTMPRNQHFVEITLPVGLSYEMLDPAALPGWDATNAELTREFGTTWQTAHRSAVLFVPSVVARIEQNLLINPDHPEFHRIEHSLHRPVWWDNRRFGPA